MWAGGVPNTEHSEVIGAWRSETPTGVEHTTHEAASVWAVAGTWLVGQTLYNYLGSTIL